jgi:hypothetical protein
MLNPVRIEETYNQYIKSLPQCAHDGVIPVDLHFLQEQGLLNHLQEDETDPSDLTQYFHVIESIEKVTLFNEQFIVWIIPRVEESSPATYVLIALNHEEDANLEVVFSTSGVYNTPHYVLKILQHFLIDVLETEATLTSFEKKAQ